MEQNRYEPIKHTTLSRAGHAIGEGAQTGFWSGLKSGGIAILFAPLGLAGLAAYGAAASGFWAMAGAGAVGLIAGGFVSALALPLIAGITVLGTGVGLMNGARHGNERTGKEHMAARYVDGYDAQMATMQNEVMAAMERSAQAQRPIVVQQAPATHETVVHEHPHAQRAHHVEKPHHQDVPSTKVAAHARSAHPDAMQYENRVAGPDLAVGAGR